MPQSVPRSRRFSNAPDRCLRPPPGGHPKRFFPFTSSRLPRRHRKNEGFMHRIVGIRYECGSVIGAIPLTSPCCCIPIAGIPPAPIQPLLILTAVAVMVLGVDKPSHATLILKLSDSITTVTLTD